MHLSSSKNPGKKCRRRLWLCDRHVWSSDPLTAENCSRPYCCTECSAPRPRHTVGQIPKKCKETSNLMWLSLIWFILVLFVCWNLFCTIANLRIKCVTETKNVSVLFYKNLKSSFLHDSHIWLWGFFTLLVALAHGVAHQVNNKSNQSAKFLCCLLAINKCAFIGKMVGKIGTSH